MADSLVADDPRDPSLETLLEAHAEVVLDRINVMVPGRIESYDELIQTATVQPLVKVRRVGEDGAIVTELPAQIHGCPVVFCGTSRGRITWPVAAGDTCELRFASASLARWVRLGGVVDPGDDRRLDVNDAVAFVGLHDAAHVPTTAPTDAVVIHAGAGVTVKLGSASASEAAVQGDAFRTALNAFLTALNTYTAAIQSIADPSTLATTAITTAANALKNASYRSSVVKVV